MMLLLINKSRGHKGSLLYYYMSKNVNYVIHAYRDFLNCISIIFHLYIIVMIPIKQIKKGVDILCQQTLNLCFM